jgi:hypothetical protein
MLRTRARGKQHTNQDQPSSRRFIFVYRIQGRSHESLQVSLDIGLLSSPCHRVLILTS